MPTPPSLTKLAAVLEQLDRIADYLVDSTLEMSPYTAQWANTKDAITIIEDAKTRIRLHIARRINAKLQ